MPTLSGDETGSTVVQAHSSFTLKPRLHPSWPSHTQNHNDSDDTMDGMA